MIIKSMSRGEKSFTQLFDYMEAKSLQEKAFQFTHNLYSSNREDIINEFKENSDFLKKRKDRIYMFHEVISLTREKGVTKEQQKEALFNIAQEYVNKRCKNNLVTGFIHDDKANNIHMHLMISSNECGEKKNLRLSKSDFDKIKKGTEKYTLKTYPELKQKKIINKKAGAKISNKGSELKRRTGKLTQREDIINKLNYIFSRTTNKTTFFDFLSSAKLEIYVRGKNIGFLNIETGRKHRLKTLGLENEFQAMSEKIQLSGEKKNIDENKKIYAEAKGRKDVFVNLPDKKVKPKKSPEPKPSTKDPKKEHAGVKGKTDTFTNSENKKKKSPEPKPTQKDIEIQKRKDEISRARKTNNKSNSKNKSR